MLSNLARVDANGTVRETQAVAHDHVHRGGDRRVSRVVSQGRFLMHPRHYAAYPAFAFPELH